MTREAPPAPLQVPRSIPQELVPSCAMQAHAGTPIQAVSPALGNVAKPLKVPSFLTVDSGTPPKNVLIKDA